MIVIATHNDSNILLDICNNFSNIDLYNQSVLIVDTNSDNPQFKKAFRHLSMTYKQFLFKRIEYKCWDSGAYINAYLNFPNEEKFIFLQDSIMIPGKSKFIETSIKLLDIYDVVPWTNFQYKFDNQIQKEWSEEGIPLLTYPTDSIFGPMFAVNRKTLDRIPKDWLKIPSNKNEACGME